jgi:hypothetical protein
VALQERFDIENWLIDDIHLSNRRRHLDPGRLKDLTAGTLGFVSQQETLVLVNDLHFLQGVQVVDDVGPLAVLADRL